MTDQKYARVRIVSERGGMRTMYVPDVDASDLVLEADTWDDLVSLIKALRSELGYVLDDINVEMARND